MYLEKCKKGALIITLVVFTIFLSGFLSIKNINAYVLESGGQEYRYENYVTVSGIKNSSGSGNRLVYHFYYNGNIMDFWKSNNFYNSSTDYSIWLSADSTIGNINSERFMMWQEVYQYDKLLRTSPVTYIFSSTKMTDYFSIDNLKTSDQVLIDKIKSISNNTVDVPKLTAPLDPLLSQKMANKIPEVGLKNFLVLLPLGLMIFSVGLLIYCWRRWFSSLI